MKGNCMRISHCVAAFVGLISCHPAIAAANKEQEDSIKACAQAVLQGVTVAENRDQRFNGKVSEARAICRGGFRALQFRNTPWVDWSNYWGTGDGSTLPPGLLSKKAPGLRGVTGALLDLELQRIELIKFNLFDNNKTYQEFIAGRDGTGGPALKRWDAMRLPSDYPNFKEVGGDGPQVCKGDLIRARTVTGICNDVLNPAMGSTGQLLARNVELETTFPDEGRNELGEEPARRSPRIADTRSASDQQEAFHPEAVEPGGVQGGLGFARRLKGCEL